MPVELLRFNQQSLTFRSHYWWSPAGLGCGPGIEALVIRTRESVLRRGVVKERRLYSHYQVTQRLSCKYHDRECGLMKDFVERLLNNGIEQWNDWVL